MAQRWLGVVEKVGILACAAGGLFGCGSGAGGGTDPEGSPGTGGEGQPNPSDNQTGSGSGGTSNGGTQDLAAVDACELLSPEWLAENIEFEFGESVWEERSTTLGECTWHNSSKLLNVRLSLWKPEARDLSSALDGPPSFVIAEAASEPEGAVLWRDASNDSAWQVWFPAGSAVGHIVQDLLMIDEEGLLAIASHAMENARVD